MSNERITRLEAMAARNPADPRPLFGLAAEYEKLGEWGRVVDALERYLAQADDEGNAWGRLATALEHMDRPDDARAALTRGIAAATQHGHPSMAAEFEERLDDL